MAFDSQRGVTVLFGGEGLYVPATGFLADTWEWNSNTWALRTPSSAPPPRAQHAMAYDAARGRVVMFGGITNGPTSTSGSVPLQDTWEWDGTNWTQALPAQSPSARRLHAMSFAATTGKTVLFGGEDNNTVTLADTWEWDGTNWLLAGSGGIPARKGAGLAWNGPSNRTVLFGGVGAGTPPPMLGDTWTWDGNAWTQSTALPQPPARGFPALIWDTWHSRTLLSGGIDNTGHLTDCWSWSSAGWTQLALLTPAPPPMAAPAAAFDSLRGTTVVFGRPESQGAPETWEAYEPITTAAVTAYGSGCGVPLPTLQAHTGSRPIIGQTQMSDITNAYLGIAFVAWGFSNQFWGGLPIPVALDPIGINGCLLWQSGDGTLGSGCISTSWTTAQHAFPIPLLPGLDGTRIYLQAWTLNPAFNPLGVVLSNGLELQIGGQ